MAGTKGSRDVSNFGRNLALWVIVALLLVALFNVFQPSATTGRASMQVAYSDFLNEVNAGHVRDVVIQGRTVSGQLSDGRTFSTYTPEDPALVSRLTEKGIRVVARPEESEANPLFQILVSWTPMLLLIGVWVFFMRQMQGGGGRAMGFGKSKAKLLTEKHGRVTFEDVAGIDEAKAELEEIVDFLRDPAKFQKLGGKIPKGVLLVGPPGTGKTLLARSIAGEANVPFFTISGSDFVEMFVGVGASRVRDMFEQGKKNAPCLIFIDEIDAVGRHRGAGLGGGNDEREQTLNQMLVEMDGFESNEGVIIIAATNRPDVLDPPCCARPLRPPGGGAEPRRDGPREDPARAHAQGAARLRRGPEDDRPRHARLLRRGPRQPGERGALLAARTGRRTVGMAEFEAAKDKVMMGAERRSLVMNDDEKRMTAYHEAGHALVAMHEEECDPVHKATIIPRGRALGLVMSLPAGDRYSKHKSKMEAELAMAMGGRVAEHIVFGADKVSNGASGDIKMATNMARMMVTEWGMSDKLGMVAYGENSQEVFLGHSVTQSKNLSEETARLIDGEIRGIIDNAYTRATRILTDNRAELELLAKGLWSTRPCRATRSGR
jgi:cell division protease FtsH